jgi:uncharacterized protein
MSMLNCSFLRHRDGMDSARGILQVGGGSPLALHQVQTADRLTGTTLFNGSNHTMVAVVVAALVVLGTGQVAGTTVATALRTWTAIDAATQHIIGMLLVGVYQLAIGLMAARWIMGATWRADLGMTWPVLKAWHWVGIVIGLYAVKAIASIVAVSVASAVSGSVAEGAAAGGGAPAGLGPVATLMRSNLWLVLLAGGVLAAIVEEIIYRGALSRTLEASRLGWFGGALLASLLWAGMHVYYPLAMQGMLVVLGVALSYVRHRTGSIYPGMVWHIVNNVVGLIALRALA